jgi:hypothetical protein
MTTPAATTAHSTIDELDFIDFLANNVKPENKKKKEYVRKGDLTVTETRDRLRGYIKSCYVRKNWAGINKVKCEQYAQKLLASLK